MICSSCNTKIRDDALICSECGMHIAEDAQKKKIQALEEKSKTITFEKLKSPFFIVCIALLAFIAFCYLFGGVSALSDKNRFVGIVKIAISLAPLAALLGCIGIVFAKDGLKSSKLKKVGVYASVMEVLTVLVYAIIVILLILADYVFFRVAFEAKEISNGIDGAIAESGVANIPGLSTVAGFVSGLGGFLADVPMALSIVLLVVTLLIWFLGWVVERGYKTIDHYVDELCKTNDSGVYAPKKTPSYIFLFASGGLVALVGVLMFSMDLLSALSCFAEAAFIILFGVLSKSIHDEQTSNNTVIESARKKLGEISAETTKLLNSIEQEKRIAKQEEEEKARRLMNDQQQMMQQMIYNNMMAAGITPQSLQTKTSAEDQTKQ